MGAKEAGRTRAESASKQWSIPSKLTLAVVPIAVVALVLGVFLVWNLAISDTIAGFSNVDALALTVGIVVTLVSLGSLVVAYRIGRSMSRRIIEVTQAARRVAHKDLVELFDALRTPNPTSGDGAAGARYRRP